MTYKPEFLSTAIGSMPFEDINHAIDVSLSTLDAPIWPQLSHFGLNEQMETIRVQLLNETSIRISEEEFELLEKYSRSLVHRIKSLLKQSLTMQDNKQRDLITPEVL